jgi:hypothetical protein
MRLAKRISAVLVGATLAVGGLAVAVAPSASAACGGYGEAACPTVTIPPGQSNPEQPTRPAPGVVVVAQSVADRTTATEETSRNTRRLAVRNATDIDLGSVFQGSVSLPGASRAWTVRLETPAGDRVDFGTLRSNRQGELTTPAIRYTRAGDFTWVFTAGSTTRFIVLRVS